MNLLKYIFSLLFVDRKEVKVMSDLAMISAGENTMEVDKVSCFLSAVMGFAPFLFDLHERDADLNALIEAFEKIRNNKEEQSKLKRKWVSLDMVNDFDRKRKPTEKNLILYSPTPP